MKGLRQEGRSLREIATSLNGSDIRSKRGGIWHPETVARVLAQSEESVSELDTTTQAKADRLPSFRPHTMPVMGGR